MFDWLKRLFGEGYIYSTFLMDNGSAGRAKRPYIGDPTTIDKEEHDRFLRLEILHKYGRTISNIKTEII